MCNKRYKQIHGLNFDPFSDKNYFRWDHIKLARLLAELGYNKAIEMPDIASKAKAQKYIGLDMDKLRAEKETFKKEVIPVWLEEAKAREAKMEQSSAGTE